MLSWLGAPPPYGGQLSPEPGLEAAELGGIPVVAEPQGHRHGVAACFTGRRGGVSDSPFDSLNLSYRVGDAPESVARNRALAAGAIGRRPEQLWQATQVHGSAVVEAKAAQTGLPEADGIWTRNSGLALMVLTADCAPIVLAGASSAAVAHGGWRGLAGGVVANTVAAMGGAHSAWVGPCIRSCCYRVGPEVVEAFRSAGLPVAGDDRVDIGEGARRALEMAGVSGVSLCSICTSCSPGYFSHRRDKVTGRQGALVRLVEPASP